VNVLRGRAHGRRAVLARAAILTEDERGRATLDPELLALAAQRHRRAEGDLDIALVAEDPLYALLLRLPAGLALAGVVAETELREPPMTDMPVVSGIPDARTEITEGEWLILDPLRRRVMVNPDAEDIALLQADTRPRVLLGAEHLPARTMGGQEVAVWARVATLDDVRAALEAGADGLAVDAGDELLPLRPLSDEEVALTPSFKEAAVTDDGEDAGPPPVLPAALVRAVEMSGGGDVALVGPPDALEPRAVVSLAGRCRLRWVLAPEELPAPAHRLRLALEAQARAEEAAYRPAAVPHLCALLGAVPEAAQAEGPGFLDGFDEAVLFPFGDDEVAALTLATVLEMPPLRVSLSGEDEGADDPLPALAYAVSAGARGVLVRPGLVAAAKERIRALE
jgi:hypothetical protein